MRIYRDQSGTHTALKNQLHQKYNPEYWTGVVHPGTGIVTISLMDMYAHLYECQQQPPGLKIEGRNPECRSNPDAKKNTFARDAC